MLPRPLMTFTIKEKGGGVGVGLTVIEFIGPLGADLAGET